MHEYKRSVIADREKTIANWVQLFSPTLSLSLSLKHTRILSNTQTVFLFSDSLTHTLSLSLLPTLSPSISLSHTLTHSHTQTISLFSDTLTHTLSLSITFPLSLSHSLSIAM